MSLDAADNSSESPNAQPSLTDTAEPPRSLMGIAGQLGPGLIIAGSIVGSGELIATTKTGAQAGIALLWLIIIGCLIKVFVQVELGRYTISHGETTLTALDSVPGPRLKVNWIIWFWFLMMLLGIGQLGAIVGGVGQAAALSIPIRGDYAEAIAVPSEKEIKAYLRWEDAIASGGAELDKLSEPARRRALRGHERMQQEMTALGSRGEEAIARVRAGETLVDPPTYDDKIWAAVVTVMTAVLLGWGRYRMIQGISMVLVVLFTAITIGNVVSLQSTEQWHIPTSRLLYGLSFHLPEASGGAAVSTALATFGIIGVGASELIAYPYWCLEKGYARYTGPRSDDADWARRARGWLRVMRYDAFASMAVYTVATLAFFLMGVAVLHNEGRDPDGMRMVSNLAAAYVPVFGVYARWLFLTGAVAVLYSTFLVATACNARMWADSLRLFGLMRKDSVTSINRGVLFFSVVLPFVCLGVFCAGINPVRAILLSGAMQALLLPMIGFGSLYFRYFKTDARIRPSKTWDVCLLVSCLGLLIAGLWGTYKNLNDLMGG